MRRPGTTSERPGGAARIAIDALPDAVLVLEPGGEVAFTNTAAERLLATPDCGPPVREALHRHFLTGASPDGETIRTDTRTLRVRFTETAEVAGGRKIGVVAVVQDISGLRAMEDQRRVLQHEIAELTLKLNARNDELDRLSRTDALTGLHNRRNLDELLLTLASMTRRTGSSLALVLIDIDSFKLVNDAYGHEAGDVILQVVADRLSESMRLEDACGRWSGQEFLIVAPFTDTNGAMALGERIRHRLAVEPVRLPDGDRVPITASVGVAAGTDADPQKLLRRASQALQRAKTLGRDQVVHYTD
ncbi:GGDEF domain-containing protein [Virgisporangium aliadipatigenens]|nr:diguanylate cyclase [Virgisporangium aliadipatigenens]